MMPKGIRATGRLIVFEGPDGVGKSTVSREVFDWLRSGGSRAELMSFPGREPGTIGNLVYQVHHDPGRFGLEGATEASRQALHIAAHLDAVERKILPCLRDGVDVIVDRFWWSTWVYGIVSGVEPGVLEALIEVERAQWGRIQPTVAILVRRDSPIDRAEPLPYWRNLCREYDRLADREATRYPVACLENTATLADALERAKEILARPDSSTTPRPRERRPRRSDGQKNLDFSEPDAVAGAPTVLTHILPVRPTVVYDTYWRFAAERQEIFFRRLEGGEPPWTNDPILGTYKFTNAYRASDRVSQYLIRSVIYRDDLPNSPGEVFFRVMLFKLFNKIETWELLESELGPLTFEEYSFEHYDRVLTHASAAGNAIYSAAYIMPSGGRSLGHDRKHRNHLALIGQMMADGLPQRIAEAQSMQRGFELLLGYPTIGDFLAYQYITDINYSEITNFSEMDFVVPGPGALDGIRKCFADMGGLNEPEVVKFMAERQDREFERLGLSFRSLWGRPLQLIDCQNLFCEVDKYSRVRHPEIAGISGRTRIKQRYSVHPNTLTCWYPPKWKINERISGSDTGLGTGNPSAGPPG
jgi:thymidylate kinase